MKTLAIKGHRTRGKEVIEILTMLGGKNVSNYVGDSDFTYYLNSDNYIIMSNWLQDKFITFTLEKFLEKYPYKVGDKVLLDNQIKIIKGVEWNSKNNEVVYTLETDINGTKTQYQVFNYDLQPYKDDTYTSLGITINGENLIVPNGYTIKTATVNDNSIIVEYIKNKPQYPKTYEECCKMLGIDPNKK